MRLHAGRSSNTSDGPGRAHSRDSRVRLFGAAKSKQNSPHAVHRDRGFVLMESIVSIGIITVLMVSLTTVFITTIQITDAQRAKQGAVRVVTEQADIVHSLGSADTLTGTTIERTIGKTTYHVKFAEETCYKAAADDPCTGTPSISDPSEYQRVTITTTWNGRNCPSTGCTYSDVILVNQDEDQSVDNSFDAPAEPALTCEQTIVWANETTNLPLIGAPNSPCSISGGTPPYTWSAEQAGGPVDPLDSLTLQPIGILNGYIDSEIFRDNENCLANYGRSQWTVTTTDSYLRSDTVTSGFMIRTPTDPYWIRDLWNRGNVGMLLNINFDEIMFYTNRNQHTYEEISGFPPEVNVEMDGMAVNTNASDLSLTVGEYHPVMKVTEIATGAEHLVTFTWHVTTNVGDLQLCNYDDLNNQTFEVGVPIEPFSIWDYAYGGDSQYRFWFDFAGQSIFSWLQIDPRTGIVTGTPTVATSGTEDITIVIGDSDYAAEGRVTLTWQVTP